MAGRGPAPKNPATRRRRNAPTRGDWQVLDHPTRKKPPPLPRPYPKGGYSPAAKAEWKRWWTSPMATMWDDADAGAVEMLLKMVDEWWDKPVAAAATQIRLMKDGLGLTPKGRRDLRWLLPGEAPPELTAIDGEKSEKSNVRRLRAVDSA